MEPKHYNSTMSRPDFILDVTCSQISPAMCNNHMSHAHAGAPLALTVKRAAIPNIEIGIMDDVSKSRKVGPNGLP